MQISTLWRLVLAALGFLGWKSIVVGTVAGFAWGGWAVIDGAAWSTATAVAFCIFVQLLFLVKLPAFYRVLAKANPDAPPNPIVWKHKQSFLLYEAACLLADINPVPDIPRGDANGWFRMLQEAIQQREMVWVRSMYDDQHTYNDGYHPYEETRITRENLKKFAEARDRHPEFLAD